MEYTSSQKMWDTIVILKKPAQTKQSPNVQKFAQSGHTVENPIMGALLGSKLMQQLVDTTTAGLEPCISMTGTPALFIHWAKHGKKRK
jgi:hypothetical protein